MADTGNSVKRFLSVFRSIREREEALRVPIPVFLAIHIEAGRTRVRIAENVEQHAVATLTVRDPDALAAELSRFLADRSVRSHRKYIAATTFAGEATQALRTRLWLDNDIICFDRPLERITVSDSDLIALAVKTSARAKDEIIPEVNVGVGGAVQVTPLIDVPAHESTCSAEEWRALMHEVRSFAGKNLLFVSATPQGGGVALMRHALIRLYESLGVAARWCVMQEDRDAFVVTKTKFHNILQGVSKDSLRLTRDDRQLYEAWTAENFRAMRGHIAWAHVIVIDDPQPSGMIPLIQDLNPHAKILYRSHIQIVARLADEPDTPQRETWQYIWANVRRASLFVSHPISAFVPKDVPPERLAYMPATTDPLDGLNKPERSEDAMYYRTLFDKLLIQNGQTPLDHTRPYIIQIARFDPSKGIPDVLEAFRAVRERMAALKLPARMLPQLVIAGNGSIDDPDGVPIYQLTMETRASEPFAAIAEDIKVARLPHIDQMLGTLLWESAVALQLSHKEGFEIKVTEALMKGVPLIAYRAGGIPLQLEDGVNGYLVDRAGDVAGVADRLHELLTDPAHRARMSERARATYRRDVLTIPNATRWLFLSNYALTHAAFDTTSNVFAAAVRAVRVPLFDTPDTPPVRTGSDMG